MRVNRSSADFVFLIGAARSGTKFLRDVLGSSECVSIVPFDINYVWRYGQEERADDCIPPQESTSKAKHYIGRTIRTMARPRLSGRDSSIVIEKTVSNVFRIPYIHRLFPDARFIYLVRDGRDVAESAARMWREPADLGYLARKAYSFPVRHYGYAAWFLMNRLRGLGNRGRRKGIWGPRYPGIVEDLGTSSVIEIAAKQWFESVRAAAEGLEAVPPDKKCMIRYENLVSDPAALRTVLEFIQVPDVSTVVSHFSKELRADLGGKWKLLPPEEQVRILEIQQEALADLGYLNGAAAE